MKNSKKDYPSSLPDNKPLCYYEKDVLPKDTNITAYIHNNKFDSFPLNMHTHDFYEINIIVKGKGVHYINNSFMETTVGDIFVITPHSKHGYYDLEDLEICHIIIGNDCFAELKNDLSKLEGFVALFYIEPKFRSEKTNNAFLSMSKQQFKNASHLFNELIADSKNNNSSVYYNVIKKCMVAELICKFCMWYTEQNSKPKNENSYYHLIITSMEYINNHYDENISIESLYKNSYLSRSSYLRYFASLNNKTPHQYITELRISKAKKLLKNTDKSITKIAQLTGFYDSSHFERVFKAEVGVLPYVYRKKPDNN